MVRTHDELMDDQISRTTRDILRFPLLFHAVAPLPRLDALLKIVPIGYCVLGVPLSVSVKQMFSDIMSLL